VHDLVYMYSLYYDNESSTAATDSFHFHIFATFF